MSDSVSKQRLDPDFVASVGKSFIAVADKHEEAWRAALATIDYRTSLNSSFKPRIENSRKDPKCGLPLPATRPNPSAQPVPGQNYVVSVRVTLSGSAKPQDSAKLERLDHPNPDCRGARYIFLQGRSDSIVLDGMYFKNVVIENAIVEYSGGPVKLENVLFVNCKIQFSPAQKSRELGNLLLTSASVSFTPAG
jgi:hypothetical protein